MQGFVIIAGEAWPVVLHPGPCLADGRAVGLGGDATTIGDVVYPVIVARDRDTVWVHLDGHIHAVTLRAAVDHLAGAAEGGGESAIRAPMPGAVVQILAAPGDAVDAGAVLLIIESMKLETAIRAGRVGVVEAVHVDVGQTFERDGLLVTLASEA